ncbi:MAG: hypothetical protein RLZZ129_1680 [Verrucomicrobiota bacterium]|jgi:phosphoglycerate dehydrogenase-like enzyme
MHSAILVHPRFDATWPFSADHARHIWAAEGPVDFVRVAPDDNRAAGVLAAVPEKITRLLVLGLALTPDCVGRFARLKELVWSEDGYGQPSAGREAVLAALAARGVRVIRHTSEGFWGQSVSEFGLALTLAALRRIPQTHRAMITDHGTWDYTPSGGMGQPGGRGQQYGDDSRFTNGTLEGKRVRIVGAGNIASRYASFCRMLGADVAAWDPFASEPAFHRAGARREHFLERLGRDAEIYVPMVPLTDKTRGLVTAAHIDALPRGVLVVLVTRAGICDMAALRRRVLADELALAADVFDVEPVPLNDPLLGRDNVVHTPHNAGRTRQAGERWVEMLLAQFTPTT